MKSARIVQQLVSGDSRINMRYNNILNKRKQKLLASCDKRKGCSIAHYGQNDETATQRIVRGDQ